MSVLEIKTANKEALIIEKHYGSVHLGRKEVTMRNKINPSFKIAKVGVVEIIKTNRNGYLKIAAYLITKKTKEGVFGIRISKYTDYSS